MKKLLLSLTLIVVSQQLSRYIMNLPGKLSRSPGDDKPKTVRDFVKELSGIAIPDEKQQKASQIFQKGTEHLFKGEVDEAGKEYKILKENPYNLADKSKSLKFNLNLLKTLDK